MAARDQDFDTEGEESGAEESSTMMYVMFAVGGAVLVALVILIGCLCCGSSGDSCKAWGEKEGNECEGGNADNLLKDEKCSNADGEKEEGKSEKLCSKATCCKQDSTTPPSPSNNSTSPPPPPTPTTPSESIQEAPSGSLMRVIQSSKLQEAYFVALKQQNSAMFKKLNAVLKGKIVYEAADHVGHTQSAAVFLPTVVELLKNAATFGAADNPEKVTESIASAVKIESEALALQVDNMVTVTYPGAGAEYAAMESAVKALQPELYARGKWLSKAKANAAAGADEAQQSQFDIARDLMAVAFSFSYKIGRTFVDKAGDNKLILSPGAAPSAELQAKRNVAIEAAKSEAQKWMGAGADAKNVAERALVAMFPKKKADWLLARGLEPTKNWGGPSGSDDMTWTLIPVDTIVGAATSPFFTMCKKHVAKKYGKSLSLIFRAPAMAGDTDNVWDDAIKNGFKLGMMLGRRQAVLDLGSASFKSGAVWAPIVQFYLYEIGNASVARAKYSFVPKKLAEIGVLEKVLVTLLFPDEVEQQKFQQVYFDMATILATEQVLFLPTDTENPVVWVLDHTVSKDFRKKYKLIYDDESKKLELAAFIGKEYETAFSTIGGKHYWTCTEKWPGEWDSIYRIAKRVLNNPSNFKFSCISAIQQGWSKARKNGEDVFAQLENAMSERLKKYDQDKSMEKLKKTLLPNLLSEFDATAMKVIKTKEDAKAAREDALLPQSLASRVATMEAVSVDSRSVKKSEFDCSP